MKTLQRVPFASQSSFFGRAGMDLLGALFERLGEEGLTFDSEFLDSILTTTEHTVGNFLAVLQSKLNFAKSRGAHTVHIRTDGASNFKSDLLVPFIVAANRVGWDCGIFISSFSFWESGDGKGRIDVHFSYKNRKCSAWVDAGNDLLTPEDFAKALSGGLDPMCCIKNSTVRLVETGKLDTETASFEMGMSVRIMHCLDFERKKDQPTDQDVECRVRSSWISPALDITKKKVDDFLVNHSAFKSLVISEVKHQVTSANAVRMSIGPAFKRTRRHEETPLQVVAADCVSRAMRLETEKQTAYQQLSGTYAPMDAKLRGVLDLSGCVVLCSESTGSPSRDASRIDRKLDEMVSCYPLELIYHCKLTSKPVLERAHRAESFGRASIRRNNAWRRIHVACDCGSKSSKTEVFRCCTQT